MSGPPFVSIVVPTFNRKDRLARVLDALDRQSIEMSAFEVVIVNDGSTDGTATWLDAQRRPYALRVLHQANGGPARARNAGVAAARADLLLFIDDDVEPTRELLREHVESHRAESGVEIVVIGPLASLPHYRQPWVAWEQLKVEDQYAAMLRGDWEPTFRQFWTGNASVGRREVLDAGGFNPDFLRAEDVELGLRLHNRGVKFRFNARARGLHHAERSLESWERMHRSYGELEVQIFGTWGDNGLVDLLAKNWANLHPATRRLVRKCLKKPQYGAVLSVALRRWLELGEKLDRPIFAEKACSLFANLIYWQASVEALGRHRAESVFARAAELKQATS